MHRRPSGGHVTLVATHGTSYRRHQRGALFPSVSSVVESWASSPERTSRGPIHCVTEGASGVLGDEQVQLMGGAALAIELRPEGPAAGQWHSRRWQPEGLLVENAGERPVPDELPYERGELLPADREEDRPGRSS